MRLSSKWDALLDPDHPIAVRAIQVMRVQPDEAVYLKMSTKKPGTRQLSSPFFVLFVWLYLAANADFATFVCFQVSTAAPCTPS